MRFRCSASATWTLTATLRRARGAQAARLHVATGLLARQTFTAHMGTGTVRLRIPRVRLAGMREVVIRVQARVRADGKSVQRSLIVRIGA